jgi:pimeloyl-ACP methyl ester carboxylesterase
MVRDLAPHFRCFVIDLPGMGGTPFVPYGPNYFAQVAAQIERVRIRNHVHRWHVVGHDGGCAIAAQYAHLFPKRVGCIALLSPAVFPELRPFFLLELLRKPVIGEITAPLVHALFWHVAMRRAIPSGRNASQRYSFHRLFSGITGPWKLMHLVRWGKPQILLKQFPSILEKLDAPALVIHGRRDILPRSFACRAVELIEDSSLLELDCGHFIPMERASEVARNLQVYFKTRGARVEPSPMLDLAADLIKSRGAGGLVPVPVV